MFKYTKPFFTNSLLTAPKYNFAVSEKAIKIRIKAVKSVEKITKAMKMVAASKMRVDLQRLERGKHFGIRTVNNIFSNESYLQKKQLQPTGKKSLLVPVTSDKGLCGAINSTIVKEVKSIIVGNRSAYKIFVVGEKGSGALLRPAPDLLVHAATELATPMNFATAASIAHRINEVATEQDCDNITLIYNEFLSVISSTVRRVDVLPKKEFNRNFKYVVKYETSEPEKDYTQQYYFELYLASQVFHALLQNTAAEQSARMNAMENASKNAKEILDKLTLLYNKARQARITMELVEVVSGANAL